MKAELEALENVLRRHGELRYAEPIRRVLDGPDAALQAFLESNELWGGAGSIADEAGVAQGRDVRREIESALLALGALQTERGLLNPRTQMWVDAFTKFRRDGR